MECSPITDPVEGMPITDNMRECSIRLHYDSATYTGDKKILSVNANFAFSTGLSYVNFLPKCPVGTDIECDIAEQTENGFAIGDLDGFQNDALVGTLYVSYDESITDATLVVSIVNVELSDSDYQMITLPDVSDEIVIGNGGEVVPPNPPVEGVEFDSDLGVDQDNGILYNVPLNTTYGALLEKITTDGTITLRNKDNEVVTDNDTPVGTNYSITIEIEGEDPIEYVIAVSDDFNGDGRLLNGDYRALLRLFKAANKDVIYRRVGNFNLDTTVDISNGNLRQFIRRFKASESGE